MAGRSGRMASPESVARAIVRAIERDHAEIRIGQTVPLYWMSRLAPRTSEWLIDRMA